MRDPPGTRRRHGILIALGLAAVVALAVLYLATRRTPGEPAAPAETEAALLNDPEVGEVLAAIRSRFPDDYGRILTRVSAAARDGGAGAREEELGLALRDFMASKARALASAPPADLQRVDRALLDLMLALRDEDAALCARQAMATLQGSGSRMSPRIRALVRQVPLRMIEAARAGADSGRPPRGAPSEADTAAFTARIRALDPASAAILAGGSMERANAETQCRVGIVMYQAAAELPPETSAAVIAELIRNDDLAR